MQERVKTLLCHPQLWGVFQQHQDNGTSFVLECDEQNRWWVFSLQADGRSGQRRQLSIPPPSGLRCNWQARQTVAVVGPDGSGKTTLIDGLKARPAIARRFAFKRFKRYFRRVLFHMRKGTDRNTLEERMWWLLLPLALVGFGITRGLVWWRGPLLLDRYFYDYFVLDARHAHSALRTVPAYRLCTALVPRPQSLVVAACPASVVHNRKNEMTVANVEAMYQVYCDQILRTGVRRTLFCHTGIDQDESLAHIVSFVQQQ